MKILLILCVTTLLCYSTSTYVSSGTIEYSKTRSNSTFGDGSKHFDSVDIFELVDNNDFYYTNYKIMSSMSYFYTSQPVYNNISKRYIHKLNILTINDMYVGYTINRYTLYIGTYSFRKGFLYEYAFDNRRVGNGIYGVITNQLQGSILKYNYSDNTSIYVGKLYSDKWIETVLTKRSKDEDIFDDTKVNLISIKTRYTDSLLQVDYYNIIKYIYHKYVGNIDLLTLAASTGINSIDGCIYYGMLSFSHTTGNNKELFPYNIEYTDKQTYFGNINKYGYKAMLGIKKTLNFEQIRHDIIIGTEIIHNSDGYNNLTLGKPVEPYNYGQIGNVLNVYTGIQFNRHSILKLRVCKYYNSGNTYKRGASPISGSTDDIPGALKNSTNIAIQLYIHF